MRNQTPPYLLRNITLNQPQSRNLCHDNEINAPIDVDLKVTHILSSQIAYQYGIHCPRKFKKAENSNFSTITYLTTLSVLLVTTASKHQCTFSSNVMFYHVHCQTMLSSLRNLKPNRFPFFSS